ncbi:MAG: BlaI/MecI/CopY family transcriptional regulator [Lachnospiraceae bacterium]|nr:BlaI/MecI/CopY family transcriptional regulator [Lachnospiraceae bacterium]MDE7358385.1 BlaI/MecI/CopY family transcriptional regulator [Lachnospiraceae bacterium]
MKKIYDVSDAEMEVMEKLWEHGDGIKQSELLALFEADGKEWKRQTLNTFLARLEGKGLVKRENRIVKVVYGREEYNGMQMKTVIDHVYGGKLSNFVASFVKENSITDTDAKELIDFLENN